MKTRPVIYPFLIAVYPILALYAQNSEDLKLTQLTIPLAWCLVITVSLWAVLWLFVKNPHRAGLLTTIAAVLFFTVMGVNHGLERLAALASDFWVSQTYNFPRAWIIPPYIAIYLGLVYLVLRKLKEPRRLTVALNLFALILITMPTMEIVQERIKASRRPENAPFPVLAKLPEASKTPKIYYIILDGFARGDVLNELYQYDLDPFLQKLEHQGFYVARSSTSNYCQTPLSLTSSLNGVHLPRGNETGSATGILDPDNIRQNAVFRTLRPLGYKFVTCGTGFDYTEFPRSDVYISPYPFISNFHRALLEAAPLRFLLPNQASGDSYTLTRERTNYVFDHLPDVAKMKGPTFAFAHILAPHPPFVFGENGEDVSRHDMQYVLNDGSIYLDYYGNEQSYVKGYRAEVTYLVKRVDAMIEKILANSSEPPIIILQSDHGSGLHLNMKTDHSTDHHERMSILNAYYFPGGKYDGLYQTITPVNSFRVVLNTMFGAKLPLEPDENYYSNWNMPFDFVRVTERITRHPSNSPSQASASPGQ